MVEPPTSDPQPAGEPRRLVNMVVTCEICAVMWDLDFDPAGCTDPDHEHALTWEPAP